MSAADNVQTVSGTPRTRVGLGTPSPVSYMPWDCPVEHLEIPTRRLAVHGMQSMQ